MSFFFETIEIPFWFIVFIFSSAAPLWLKWYKLFYKKYIVTGSLKRIFKRKKTEAELKEEILKKATDHWEENSEFSGFSNNSHVKRKKVKKNIDPVKKENINVVLKILAKAGEAGILPRSISDELQLSSVAIDAALSYLIEKDYVEATNSSMGKKYYLTSLGRKYCINKKYISA